MHNGRDSMLTNDIEKDRQTLEALSPEALLAWAAQRFKGEMLFSTSLGAEDCVILDMIFQQKLPITVASIETGVLFEETYALWSRLEKRYDINIVSMRTDLLPVDGPPSPEIDELWKSEPDRCCHLRKIVPLRRELDRYQAWITGIRREQSEARRNARAIEWDLTFGLVKINPLVNWKQAEVWDYLRKHDVPYNPLHDAGYPSIGCEPCTAQVQVGQDERAGRWQGREKTECGLHEGAPSPVVLHKNKT